MTENAAIDFGRQKPEAVHGVRPLRTPVNWDALALVVQRSDGSALQKSQMMRRFFKAVREHGIESLTPPFRYSYCCARLALGDFSSYFGWEFRAFESKDNEGWAARLFWDETWLPKWGGGCASTVLVLGEQGIGDMVFFASMLPDAMRYAKQVIIECDERLHTLFRRSFPGLRVEAERPFEDRRTDYGAIDAFIPAADLMRMFRRSKSHFPRKPYLIPDPDRVARLADFEGRVGIAWRGRQGSIDPSRLCLKHPVSLQYCDSRPYIQQPPIDLWDDIEAQVALCSVLARVVTVPMTIHHLAGAVGTKTEIILPNQAGEVVNQIRWDVPLGHSPWYRDATVYRNIAEWQSLMETEHA